MDFAKSEILLGLCGMALVALTGFGLALPHPVPGQFGIGYGVALQQFVVLACVQGVVYFAAVALLLRFSTTAPERLWLILGVAILLRLMVVVFPPFLSNDMYRYIWDGWVQQAGINPYRYIPDDPHLLFLRDAVVFPNINRADYAHTIYPPAAEMFFAATTWLSALLMLPPVLGTKLALLAAEAAGIWAMLRMLRRAGLPSRRILIYAWNPLPVWEFAGSGHVDAITVCFIALALLAAGGGRSGIAGAALAAATLTKFLPLVLFPALWRRWDWKLAVVFTGLVVLLYLPYLGVGMGVFGFLGGYTAQEGIDSGQGIFLAGLLGLSGFATKIYLLIVATILAAAGAVMVFRSDNSMKAIARNSLLLGCLLMAGISPHYPWYYAFLLVPACIVPAASSLYLVTASFLLYLNPTHTKLLWPSLLFGPFAVLIARDVWISMTGARA